MEGREAMPEWLTTGDTNLIPKPEETKNPSKVRLITCYLPCTKL